MLYESQNMEKERPSPIAAIEFRMDQAGLTPRDLIPFMGSRAKVSEVLSGKRGHHHVHGPRTPQATLAYPAGRPPTGAWRCFRRRVRRHRTAQVSPEGDGETQVDYLIWPDLLGNAEELVRGLMERAGGRETAAAGLYRKNDHRPHQRQDR